MSYTLDNMIEVSIDRDKTFIEVRPDPDGMNAINVRTRLDKRSTARFGSIDLFLEVEAAVLLATAIEKMSTVIENKTGLEIEGYSLLQRYRVYDDNNGTYLEVSRHPDDTEVLWLNTITNKTSSEYWGEIDVTLTTDFARLLAQAIRIVSADVEGRAIS